MKNTRFRLLVNDTKIQAIGQLFRKKNNSRWGINVGFYPFQEKHALEFSNAPILARGRTLNLTVVTKRPGYHCIINIDSTQSWLVKKIEDCALPQKMKVRKQEESQHCFVFQDNSGRTVILPQFELARALFFHDGYMSRTAVEPDCLKAEFDVIIDRLGNEARINVMPTSGYPLRSFDNPGARRVLSWILIDPDARASFESIGRYQKLNGFERAGYRYWDFQFDPPLLPNLKFEVRGVFDRESNTLFVNEIDALQNIRVDVPEVVIIYHPSFRNAVQGDGDGEIGMGSVIPPEQEVIDGGDANSNNNQIILNAPGVIFDFAKPFKTIKTADRKQSATSGRRDDDVGDVSSGVSVDEPTTTGDLPCADWETVSDETDDAHLYANKFDCFHKMIDLLVADSDCMVISKQIRKLPKVSRCKKHLLATDWNPRCIVVIELAMKGVSFHILEVDTSDSANALSTQVLLLKSPIEWGTQLESLEKELVRRSLHWPSDLLEQLCGVGKYKGISHPKTSSSDKGLLEPDSIAHWAQRLYEWMHAML